MVRSGIRDYVFGANLTIGVGSGSSLAAGFTYYLSDNRDIRVLTDGFGNYLGQQAHLPFGEDFAESGTQDKHHLTTYEREPEAGIDYAVNRQYEFNLGRFMASDPMIDAGFNSNRGSGCALKRNGKINPTDPQSLNLYTYVENDPVNSADPSGLEVFNPCSLTYDPQWGVDGLDVTFGPDGVPNPNPDDPSGGLPDDAGQLLADSQPPTGPPCIPLGVGGDGGGQNPNGRPVSPACSACLKNERQKCDDALGKCIHKAQAVYKEALDYCQTIIDPDERRKCENQAEKALSHSSNVCFIVSNNCNAQIPLKCTKQCAGS